MSPKAQALPGLWAEAGPVNCIRRANLDGTGVEEVVVGLVTPMSVAIDDVARKIYWTDFDGQKIQRASRPWWRSSSSRIG